MSDEFGPVEGSGTSPNVFQSLLGGAGGLLGGILGVNSANNTNQQLADLTSFNPQGFTSTGGFGISEGGNVSLGGGQEALMQQLQQMAGSNLGGGLFNNNQFQNAFQNNDIAGALQNANNQFNQQLGASPFGQLGNLAGQAQGLSGQFANQVGQGPQDTSGGLMAQLFGQGFGNQLAAGNQQGLFNQSLDTQRQAAQGGLLDQAINKFRNVGRQTGRSSTSAGAADQTGFLDSLARQDLGFQNNAFGQAQAQQNFLGNLGSQQIQQGQGFLGQSLGQFNQNAQNALGFGGQAAGLAGQQFGQNLQSGQFNQQGANARLQNALGLFGQGNDIRNQSQTLGLQGQAGLTDINSLFADTFLGQQNAAANRISSSGLHAQSIANSGSESGGLLSGLVSSGLGLLGFSDARLKDDIVNVATIDGLGYSTWKWNDEAHRVEMVTTDPESGYYMINYGGIA
jgi:hypothetical protein